MKRIITLLMAVAFVTIGPLYAQTESTTGSINGVVTESTGSALPGVTVTATNSQTGLTRTVVTEDDGGYQVPLLPPGTYRVTAELSGLGSAARERVAVLLGTSAKVDIILQPQVTEEITVTAAAPVVDTTEAGLTSSVTEAQIENLPLLGRDFSDLVLLTPGAIEAFGERVSVNGGRGITTDYNIDGANANSDFFGEERGGTEAPFVFSQAAIKEFQVIRTSYSAEFARGVGGTMNAITKSGTNALSGEVFFFRRDKGWADERDLTGIEEFFDPKDVDQYGAAFGGPIIRDRLHYFAAADFQEKAEPFFSTDIRNDTTFRALPAETQTAFITRLEQLLGHTLDEEFVYDTLENQDTYMLKLDFNAGDRHHLALRDNFSDYHNYPSESSSAPLSNQGDEFNTVNSIVLEVASVLTSSMFNQFIAQHSLEERPISALNTSFPSTRIGGLRSSFTFGQTDFLPNRTDEEKLELKDSLSYVWGDHQFKAGFNYLTAEISNLFVRDLAGDWNFDSVADFLANRPRQFEQGYGAGDPATPVDFAQFGLFIMDTLRPWKNLTLDVGIRWDGQDAPKPLRNVYEATNPNFDDDFKDDNDNIAPRLGMAWDVRGNGRSVLRAGAGMYYQFVPAIIYANPVATISGIFTNYQIDCRSNPCPTYPNLFTPEELATRNPAATLDIPIVSPDLQAQESLRMSLGFEQQIGSNYSASVELVHADLDKVKRLININAIPTGLMFGNVPQYRIGDPSRPFPNFRNVRMHVSDSEGRYDAATVSFQRPARGDSKLSWLAHYTWSETIDQDDDERSTSTQFSLDPYNRELYEGRYDFDITHKAVFSATYELPFGFLVSGIYNWRSGVPYSPFIDFPGSNSPLNGLQGVNPDVPVFLDSNGNIIDITQASGSTPQEFADFLNARGARIQSKNSENQPDFSNLDFRLSKRFDVFREFEFELIGEIFNVLNEENKFITASNQEMFDITTSGSGANLRYNITRNARIGVPNALSFSSPPRQYQAAIKIHF